MGGTPPCPRGTPPPLPKTPPPPLGAFGPLLMGGGVAYKSEETSPLWEGSEQHSGPKRPHTISYDGVVASGFSSNSLFLMCTQGQHLLLQTDPPPPRRCLLCGCMKFFFSGAFGATIRMASSY